MGCDYVQSGRVAAGLVSLCTEGRGLVGIAAADGPNSPSFAGRMGGFSQELTHHPGLSMVNGGMPALFHDGEFSEVVELVEQNPDMKAIYIVNMGTTECARRSGGQPVTGICRLSPTTWLPRSRSC